MESNSSVETSPFQITKTPESKVNIQKNEESNNKYYSLRQSHESPFIPVSSIVAENKDLKANNAKLIEKINELQTVMNINSLNIENVKMILKYYFILN
jgi:hypothetical protein